MLHKVLSETRVTTERNKLIRVLKNDIVKVLETFEDGTVRAVYPSDETYHIPLGTFVLNTNSLELLN